MVSFIRKCFSERPYLLALLGLMVLITYGDLLFSGQRVISHLGNDLWSQFYHWRQFGFGQIAHGNLPMWNPHLFSGAPYLGNTQSALLYPLNLLFLLLPNALAINWSVALHSWLGGALTLLWLRHKKLHPHAALFGAGIMMFAAPYFLHIYAGHLSNINTMVWFPLILLGLDKWLDERDSQGFILGAIAVAMQVFAGHPQYLYYSGIAVGIYTLGRIAFERISFRAAAIGMGVIYIVGVALSAIQFLPALEASTETVRAGGVGLDFASMFSLPPENILTLFAPGIFGDALSTPYWGGNYLWEMNLYIGVITFSLALYALGIPRLPLKKTAIFCAIALLILAVGKHTPVFGFLYHYLPGFDLFRGSSKFSFFACFFLVALASSTASGLLNGTVSARKYSLFLLTLGVVLILVSGILRSPGMINAWQELLHHYASNGEGYLAPDKYADIAFIRETHAQTVIAVLISALLLTTAGIALLLKHKSPATVYLILLLAVGETTAFALRYRSSFSPVRQQHSALYQVDKSQNPTETRILNPFEPNAALSTGEYNIWGYDPGVPKRYAEFLAASLGYPSGTASQYLDFNTIPDIFGVLRLSAALYSHSGKIYKSTFDVKMQQANLIYRAEEFSDSRALLTRLTSQGFDYQHIALVEQPLPFALGKPHADDHVVITPNSTDDLTIEAKLDSAALLLVTDSFSRGWRAYSIDGSAQNQYDVMPADHALIGIPLKKGHHYLRLEYRPRTFYPGLLITLATLIGLLYQWRRTRRKTGLLTAGAPAAPTRT